MPSEMEAKKKEIGGQLLRSELRSVYPSYLELHHVYPTHMGRRQICHVTGQFRRMVMVIHNVYGYDRDEEKEESDHNDLFVSRTKKRSQRQEECATSAQCLCDNCELGVGHSDRRAESRERGIS